MLINICWRYDITTYLDFMFFRQVSAINVMRHIMTILSAERREITRILSVSVREFWEESKSEMLSAISSSDQCAIQKYLMHLYKPKTWYKTKLIDLPHLPLILPKHSYVISNYTLSIMARLWRRYFQRDCVLRLIDKNKMNKAKIGHYCRMIPKKINVPILLLLFYKIVCRLQWWTGHFKSR